MLIRILATIQFTHTYDELYHIPSGLSVALSGQQTVDVTHPPLAWMGTGYLLKYSGVKVPELATNTQGLNFDDSAWMGRRILFDQSDQSLTYWSVLTRARLPMLFWPLLGMLVLYRLGSYLFNGRVAMLTCCLFSTDPLLLGHAILVNNDVAIMAMFSASFLTFLRFIARPNWRRALLAGCIFGLAMGTKFTALALLPIFVACIALRVIWKYPLRRKHRQGIIPSLITGLPSPMKLIGTAATAAIVLWGIYFFQVGHLSSQHQFDYTPKFQSAVQKIHDPAIPAPSFLTGLAYQISHSAKGHTNFFDGKLSMLGSPLYFPQMMAMKLPIGTILAVGLGLLIWLIHRRHWQMMLLLAVPVGAYLYVSVTGKVNIGMRHLMPILPLLYMMGMVGLQRLGKGLVPVLLILVAFVETAMIHPNYLSFFNVAAGGVDHADRYVADSNLDWGQDFQLLADWLDQNHRHLDSARLWNKCPYDLLQEVGIDPATLDQPIHGLFAISRLVKAGVDSSVVDEATGKVIDHTDYSWLKNHKRVALIGGSIEVYDFGDTPVPAYHKSPVKSDADPVPSPRFRPQPATSQP